MPLELQELLKLISSCPGGSNTIKHSVDGVCQIRTTIRCEGGVVQEGLSCAETIIQLRNETTVFGVVDKDQASLPPYYHQAVVCEKHARRNAATIRSAGGEHFKAGPGDLAFVDRALFHGAHKESPARLIHRHALGVHIRAVKKRVQKRRRMRQ